MSLAVTRNMKVVQQSSYSSAETAKCTQTDVCFASEGDLTGQPFPELKWRNVHRLGATARQRPNAKFSLSRNP